MPWKECHVMDERLRFVARLLVGEKMVSFVNGSQNGAWRTRGPIPDFRYFSNRTAGSALPRMM